VRVLAFGLLVALSGNAFSIDALSTPLSGAKGEPLAGLTGDPARGRAIVVNRQLGLCLLCHNGPFPEERFQGSIGPDLNGIGSRLSEENLRMRIVDPARFNPSTIMPAYFRTQGLVRVAPSFKDKPILSAQQIEDVVAFLGTLK
jgi:sulfur-oxidizing protein SoxX